MKAAGRFWLCLAFATQLAACSDSDSPGSRPVARPGDAAFAHGGDSIVPDSVRQELIQLGVQDQEVRQGLTPERMQDTVFAKSMLRGDSARTVRLQSIVDAYGWPDSVRAGPEAAQAAFLILQHSPSHEFQKEMLPVIEDLAKQAAVPRQDAALLVDRVLMHDDLPQRYGTQFTMVDGRLVLHPVEDEAKLEERRRSMGLPSMDEYIRLIEEFYRAQVVPESR